MVEGVDLERLDALLASIGWTRARMEMAIGRRIDKYADAETKRLIWSIMRSKAAREAWTLWKLYFPKATIERAQ